MASDVQPSSVIGRELELARLVAWANDPVAPPLVVTGPGGIGKTALLRAFMATREDGITVDCAPCSSVEEVGIVLAEALDLAPAAGREPRRLARRAAERGIRVLAFDNLEQLAGAANALAPLFGVVPHALATSRIALELPRETSFALAPLACGDANGAGVLLLASRSGLGREEALTTDDTALLTRIARSTDGIPLAIELAAKQVATFGLAWTAERLGPEPLALETTFGSSWASLSDDERRAVARLSLFSGLFAIGEAAGALGVDLDAVSKTIASLVRQSWISVHRTGARRSIAKRPAEEPRYRMLLPLREFARQRLAESPELDAARARFEDFVLVATESCVQEISGDRARDAILRIGRFSPSLLEMMTPDATSPEHAERAVRAALVAARWALEVGALSAFAEAVARPAAERAIDAAPRERKLRAWMLRARVDWRLGRLAESRARAERALQIAETDEEIAGCLLLVAHACAHGGQVEEAYQFASDAREYTRDPALACEIALPLAAMARALGLDVEARAATTEGIAAARAAGDVASESRLQAMSAALSYDAGELERAEVAARDAVQLVGESDAALFARMVLADVLAAKGAWDEAEACLDRILDAADDQVMAHVAASFSRAQLAFKRGRIDVAQTILDALADRAGRLSIRVAIDALAATVYARAGRLARAERAATAAYAVPTGTVEPALARTLLLAYELEQLRLSPRDPAPRARIEATLAHLAAVGERGRSWLASSGDVRSALDPMREALVAAGFVVPADSEDAAELTVAGDADEARLGGRSLVLAHRQPLRRILAGLLAAPKGEELTVDGIFALGWPGERATPRAARNRVHVALATLRKELLGPWLRRSRCGYSLDPALRIVRRATRASRRS